MGYVEFSNPVSTTPKIIIKNKNTMKMPLFSNNSQVYYKPKSLAAGGVGTVRNVGSKSRRI